MNEYFPTVVQVIPLDNFHEQVLLHEIFLATEMSPVTLTLIRLLYMSAIKIKTILHYPNMISSCISNFHKLSFVISNRWIFQRFNPVDFSIAF